MNTESALKDELLILKQNGQLSEKYYELTVRSIHSFKEALVSKDRPFEPMIPLLRLFFKLILEQVISPHKFEPYHQKLPRYHQFSLDFFRPLINLENSKVIGSSHLDTISKQLAMGENVIFLANHQTEADPQVIALLLEKTYPTLSNQIIYVAGERVLTDPMAIPFSLGTDLLCIYSKRYIDFPPEKKASKQNHNKITMERMCRLLQEGGKAIYVAPSGGRDRKDSSGKIRPAQFDPNSIEMFYLMAKKAKTPTHFYPLALDTYNLLPPPESIQIELGELRQASYTPVRIGFGPECEMEVSSSEPKEERRKGRADMIWKNVCKLYEEICRC